jgi:hypothetical protein
MTSWSAWSAVSDASPGLRIASNVLAAAARTEASLSTSAFLIAEMIASS